jgi:hypothetical protein
MLKVSSHQSKFYYQTKFFQIPSLSQDLSSELEHFEAVNDKGEFLMDQVLKYASLLIDEELAGKNTLSITERRLFDIGIPRGQAAAISETAMNSMRTFPITKYTLF